MLKLVDRLSELDNPQCNKAAAEVLRFREELLKQGRDYLAPRD